MNQPGRSQRYPVSAPRSQKPTAPAAAKPAPQAPAIPVGILVSVSDSRKKKRRSSRKTPVLMSKPAPRGGSRLLRHVLLVLVAVLVIIGSFEIGMRYLPGSPRNVQAKRSRQPAAAAPVTVASAAPVKLPELPPAQEPKPPVVAPPSGPETRTPPPMTNVPPPEVKTPPPAPPKPTPPPTPPPATVRALTYEEHILPIFDARCLNCHGAGSIRGSLDLRTLTALREGGVSGAGVKPGTLKDNVLWERIADNSMPPGKTKLTEEQKKLIQEWILGGARGMKMAAKP